MRLVNMPKSVNEILEDWHRPFHAKRFDDMFYYPIDKEHCKSSAQCKKYPVILEVLPEYLSKSYSVSKSQIQINGTALGLSRIQKDERINKINEYVTSACKDFSDLQLIDRIYKKDVYYFKTTISGNGKKYIPLNDWVSGALSEISNKLGMYDYILCINSFFVGIQDAEKLNFNLKSYIDSEVKRFWETVDIRLKRLSDNVF